MPLITQSDQEKSFPPVTTPPEGDQTFPVQESGCWRHRPSIHQPHADAIVHRRTGQVTATRSVRGKVGVSLAVYPDNFLPFTATPFTVVQGRHETYTWDTTTTACEYAFSIYGRDGFLTSFAVPSCRPARTPGRSRPSPPRWPGSTGPCSAWNWPTKG